MEVRNGSSQLKFANYGKDETGARAFTCRGVWCVGGGRLVCFSGAGSGAVQRMSWAALLLLLVVVVLLTPQEVATPRTDSIIRSYFEKGFSYRLILYFLVAYHGHEHNSDYQYTLPSVVQTAVASSPSQVESS